MGTSNLSNISETPTKDIQIESFPGAQIRHMDHLIKNFQFKSKPKTLILDIGINDRRNSFDGTTLANLRRMTKTISNSFPETKIYIPIVQFSEYLPKESKDNLRKLNETLPTFTSISILPPLPRGFRTIEDDIHWTDSTANALLKHWIGHLN